MFGQGSLDAPFEEGVQLFFREAEEPFAKIAIAKSFWSRAIGWLGRRHLRELEGLLIIPGGSIHTLGMRFPIDVVFLNRQMVVIGVRSQIPPWRLVRAPRRTYYTLELEAQAAANIQIGARVQLAGP